MGVDTSAGGPGPTLEGMIHTLPGSRRSDLVIYVPIIGVAIYASMATMALGFYNRLNVTFEEVGLSYTSLLTRALLVVAVASPPLAVLAAALGTVTASWRVTNLLVTVLDSPHVSWPVKALLLTAALELAGSFFFLSWRAQDVGRTVLILAIMTVSIVILAALVGALKWAFRGPRGRIYVTSAVFVLVMATSFYLIGGTSADRMLTGDGHRRLVASLGVVRWPLPVAVAGDPLVGGRAGLGAGPVSTAAGARASHVFLFEGRTRLLLQATGPDHRNPGRIGSSVAGFVKEGETYIEAARRRTREELGITPALLKIGNIRSPEPGGFKFSEVFRANAAGAYVALPGHVGSIVRLEVDEVSSMLTDDPSRFTPTFPYVFRLLEIFLSQPQ